MWTGARRASASGSMRPRARGLVATGNGIGIGIGIGDGSGAPIVSAGIVACAGLVASAGIIASAGIVACTSAPGGRRSGARACGSLRMRSGTSGRGQRAARSSSSCRLLFPDAAPSSAS